MYQTPLAEKYKEPLDRFFAFARERHSIYQRRQANPKPPWTDDPILHKFRFTNVFRELDATTVWCRRYVRERFGGLPELLPAVVLFRWFNRITTGETLFSQPDLISGETVFDEHLVALQSRGGVRSAISVLRHALRKQPPPHVTGSYTINTAGLGTGKTKVEGVLAQYAHFLGRDWRVRAEQMATPAFKHTMEGTCIWLQDTPGMGGFMSYEIACDLRYTHLLSHASDVNTWAHAGPGAQRGIRRVVWGSESIDDVRRPVREEAAVEDMKDLLDKSRLNKYWPQDWPAWEMREVEHTLCEFDKYERARLGQGRPRGVFQ